MTEYAVRLTRWQAVRAFLRPGRHQLVPAGQVYLAGGWGAAGQASGGPVPRRDETAGGAEVVCWGCGVPSPWGHGRDCPVPLSERTW